ncbi:DNA/RNA non-specific endonuclease [Citricoccus sp. GCM10030269]|uniref:DNA/RNA non-specific endonuclease n=1 Tax=Citricoccus sp. GCM10030269 TaxID=3273388 RepID=UPI003622D6E4
MTASTGTSPDRTDDSTVQGYDPAFLGTSEQVPAPSHDRLVVLDYVHFSVHQDTERRLAANTAVNIDGARLRDVGRSDHWRFDDRLPREHQSGEDLYGHNDLDRGHLVRRRDPVWGEDSIARQANSDTFHYTVAAPQAGYFNQSHELWLGVEDHVLEHARAAEQKLSVFTGCLFADDDPEYRGEFLIPRRFFKIAAWNLQPELGTLATTGYLLDQGEGLDRIIRRGLRPGEEVEGPGPFKTYQVPVADIAELSGLAMEQLIQADRYRVPADGQDEDVRSVRAVRRWRELEGFDDITL